MILEREICPICRNVLLKNDYVTTPCNHKFCNQCFFHWMRKGRLCPLCRERLIEKPVEEAQERLYRLKQEVEETHRQYKDLVRQKKQNKETITRQQSRIGQLKTQIRTAKLVARKTAARNEELVHDSIKYKAQLGQLRRQMNYSKEWLQLYSTKDDSREPPSPLASRY